MFEPLELARCRVLLPTRRACLALRNAFADHLGATDAGAMLLPRLVAVGDLDADLSGLSAPAGGDLRPPLEPLRARFLLTDLVRAQDPSLADEQAFKLAAELLGLVDELAIEDGSLASVFDMPMTDLAAHWQSTLDFLTLLDRAWPLILDDEGAMLQAERRQALLAAVIRDWHIAGSNGPVIAAGLTGSQPAVARFMRAVAALPQGLLVLPGYDPPVAAGEVPLPPQHPQWAMARALAPLVQPVPVHPWPEAVEGAAPARGAWLRAAFPRPGEVLEVDVAAALAGVRWLEAADQGHEALAIAIRLRETVEVLGRRAVLVTGDRQLARRVAAELARFGLDVDDSGGLPLDQTTPGRFCLLAAHWLLEPNDPGKLLALLRHPFARLGLPRGELAKRVQALDLAIRERNRREGAASLRAAAGDVGEAAEDLLHRLERAAAPVDDLGPRGESVSLAALIEAHLQALSRLATGEDGALPETKLSCPDPLPEVFASGAAGRALSLFWQAFQGAVGGMRPVAASAYPPILASAMAVTPVREVATDNHGITILGRLEARLVDADLVVLGGLNEGSWPAAEEPSPWLGKAMRDAAGLPAGEQGLGFAAHDFVQLAAAAPQLLLTRSRRDAVGGAAVPSRFVAMLDRVLGPSPTNLAAHVDGCVADLVAALDALPGGPKPVGRPEPNPPRAARPVRLSVSDVERLIHNPYAVYAKRVLGLEPLPPLQLEPGAAERGTLVHRILERFGQRYAVAFPEPEEALARLMTEAETVFGATAFEPAVRALWEPRFERIARWFALEFEGDRRPGIVRIEVERTVERLLALEDGRQLQLTGRIDRLELAEGGSLRLLDYKTGAVPNEKDVRNGDKPQLPLLAWLLLAEDETAAIDLLAFVELSGKAPPGRLEARGKDVAAAIAETAAGAHRLLTAYCDGGVPFLAVPRPTVSAIPDPYRHLSRDAEWLQGAAAGRW